MSEKLKKIETVLLKYHQLKNPEKIIVLTGLPSLEEAEAVRDAWFRLSEIYRKSLYQIKKILNE